MSLWLRIAYSGIRIAYDVKGNLCLLTFLLIQISKEFEASSYEKKVLFKINNYIEPFAFHSFLLAGCYHRQKAA